VYADEIVLKTKTPCTLGAFATWYFQQAVILHRWVDVWGLNRKTSTKPKKSAKDVSDDESYEESDDDVPSEEGHRDSDDDDLKSFEAREDESSEDDTSESSDESSESSDDSESPDETDD
jgi:hypothetical protein